MISSDHPAHREMRQSIEKFILKHWRDDRLTQENAVAGAAAMAINDSLTTKKLHPLTKMTLDHLWTVQNKDGSFPWLDDTEPPPLGGDAHYGVALAAIAVGAAPEGYALTDTARQGLARIRRWLSIHPAKHLHSEAMLLWASSYHDGLLKQDVKSRIIATLYGKQLKDGSWSLPTLGSWKRKDGKEQTLMVGDGYATGLCIFVMRRAGVSQRDPAVARGISWLKSHQRERGGWFTRSLWWDDHNYLSHIGSAFAVMAIQACAEPSP